MRYLSVCAGIEAATMAWHPLGWEAAAFSEIEPFPRAVLAHHYPDTPLHGDFTNIEADQYGPIDLLVGGTPCQSFSVAGLRGGLDDDRGNLALEFLRLAQRTRAKWLVWENVPGVLSSNGGRDFGAILGGMVELGYGFAYRVLDAQHFGVPQRRRRVFVVGYLGDWRPPAAVLFERHSLSGHSAPRREKGQRVAGAIARCSFSGGAGGRPEGAAGNHFVTATLTATYGEQSGQDMMAEGMLAVTHSLRGEGFDASEDGTGRGTPIVPVAFNLRGREHGAQPETDPDNLAAMRAASGGSSRSYIAFTTEQTPKFNEGAALTLTKQSPTGGGQPQCVMAASAVRRLTPVECERLQGFPDNFTQIPWRGKPASECPDGPRYKALGNSMAVPVMRWIGERIAAVAAIEPTLIGEMM